ncbi:hypothetical protein A1Q1_06104 [Trichosporon asahii var. asahii CBS 2479]|uniref:Uncharacterized protein n=1 Tax=Trichosporon asahii var. asahii (strain ATCC 90039 / CBS 2479 / JCM 2466 / KCTC 7840 / NBRC 103889/ NCYC 2677 / UAMH 7654) TaxID=1186058 RepID=J5SF34_TRIAS|nr:hypothetical protein A1Q1_06104 [Trichosporon asahii var. asahii CBS 2479]EJT45341.1 hypothetical protein A1Q1_06104 [Trichosporon asahii var. asahii CBS 2479]
MPSSLDISPASDQAPLVLVRAAALGLLVITLVLLLELSEGDALLLERVEQRRVLLLEQPAAAPVPIRGATLGIRGRHGAAVAIVPQRRAALLALHAHAARHRHARVHEAGLEAGRVVRDLGLARNVEQEDAHEDREEATQERDGVNSVGRVEALEKDGRGDNGRGREEDVVDRVDDVGRERVERLVEVVHLDQDARHDDDAENVRADVRELVVARDRELERDTKALDGHDGHGTDERADREVHHGILSSIARHDAENHKRREHGDKAEVQQERQVGRVRENLVDRLDLLVARRVQDNDDRADDAARTAAHSQSSELLIEHERGEDRTNDDTHRSSGVTRIAGANVYAAKFATGMSAGGSHSQLTFSHYHRDHSRPPDRILEIRQIVGCMSAEAQEYRKANSQAFLGPVCRWWLCG